MHVESSKVSITICVKNTVPKNSVCLCKEILNLASFETTKPLFLKYCLDDFASNIGCASYLLE